MGMSSIFGIVEDYIESLKSARDGRMPLNTIFVQIILPIFVGALSGIFMQDFPELSDVVTGISIVSSLMFAAATLLFQTRIELRKELENETQYFLTNEDLKLIDGLFSQVLWSILSGFILVLTILVVDMVDPTSSPAVNIIFGFIATGLTNFILTVGIALKRMRRVYSLVAKNVD